MLDYVIKQNTCAKPKILLHFLLVVPKYYPHFESGVEITMCLS